MAHPSFREKSRNEWYPQSGQYSNEDLQVGCLQRIADATELMARNYAQMERDLKWYKERSERMDIRITGLENTNKALRGHITRLKNKTKA